MRKGSGVITHYLGHLLRTILGLALLASLFQPSHTYAWPLDSEWIVLTRSFTGLTDIIGDAQGGANDPRDIVTNSSAFPSAYIFNDGTYLYYRIRVDGNALNNQGTGLRPFGWGFLIDTNNNFSDYEWMVMLNGISNPETIVIGQNTVQGTPGDPSDRTEVDVWTEEWRLNVNFRTQPADSFTNGGQDYFLDFRIPYAVFKAKTGLTDYSPIRYFIGSSNNAQSLTADLVDISNICVPATINQCMPANASDTVTLQGTYPSTGTVRFVTSLTGTIDLTQIYSGQTVYIQVVDEDVNTNHAAVQTLNVTVTTQTGDSETVLLTETGANTGIFTGYLATSSGTPVLGSGTLEVSAIETVTATYIDAIDSSFATNQIRTDTLTVRKAADLSVAITADKSTPVEGETVVFTIAVSNSGPNDATGIQVTDLLPAGVTWIADSGAGTYNRTTGVWEVPSLVSGASTSLSIAATVNAGTTGATLTNSATITASSVFDPVSGNNSASRGITVGGADLAVTATASTSSPPSGGAVSFTIALRNNGASTASGITVTDLLPPGLSYVSSTMTQGSYASGTGLWNAGSLSSGATATLTVNATVTAAAGATITNTASITASNQADPNTANNAASVVIYASGVDLAVAKTVSNAAPNEGSSIVYTLAVSNNGLYTANTVTVSDLLPSGLTYVSSAGVGTYSGVTGLWSIPTITAGGTAARTITATVNAGTNGSVITNTATITGASLGDPNGANNTASAAVTVQRADLSVTKTASNLSPNKNQAFSYTVVLRNNGPHSATTMTVQDVIDTGNITYNSSSATIGSVVYAGPILTWSIPGPLASGANATLTINVTVRNNTADGTTVHNMAEVLGAAQADPVNANNQSIASIVVGVGTTDLAITKSVNTTAPTEGALVTYTVVVSNPSLTPATNVTVADALPAGLTYAAGSSSQTQGNYNANQGIWTVGTLNPGGAATMLLAATVNAGTTGQTIRNAAAIIGATQIDINPANDTASVSLVVGATDLAVTKAVNTASPNVGSTIVYTVGLRNNGPGTATAVEVTDILPPGLTFVSASATAGAYANGTGIWSIATLNSGVTATLTLTASVNAGTAGTTITNTAAMTAAGQPDNVAANNSASASVTVQAADLAVTKTASNLAPAELDPVVYTVTVMNNGPNDATNVVVQDLLTSGLTYSSHVVSQGTYTASSGLWTVGAIVKDGAKTLQITARPNIGTGGTSVPNIASVSAADQADTDGANNGATITITPVTRPAPNIVTLKAAQAISDPVNGTSSPKAIPGAVMQYTITASNQGTGSGDANSIVITDPVPANTELFVGDLAAPGSGPVAFSNGVPPSGLSYTFLGLGSGADSIEFSNTAFPYVYGYIPSPDAGGFDAQVSSIRITLGGSFAVSAGAPYPSFTLQFRVRVR